MQCCPPSPLLTLASHSMWCCSFKFTFLSRLILLILLTKFIFSFMINGDHVVWKLFSYLISSVKHSIITQRHSVGPQVPTTMTHISHASNLSINFPFFSLPGPWKPWWLFLYKFNYLIYLIGWNPVVLASGLFYKGQYLLGFPFSLSV